MYKDKTVVFGGAIFVVYSLGKSPVYGSDLRFQVVIYVCESIRCASLTGSKTEDVEQEQEQQ